MGLSKATTKAMWTSSGLGNRILYWRISAGVGLSLSVASASSDREGVLEEGGSVRVSICHPSTKAEVARARLDLRDEVGTGNTQWSGFGDLEVGGGM